MLIDLSTNSNSEKNVDYIFRIILFLPKRNNFSNHHENDLVSLMILIEREILRFNTVLPL